MSRWSINGESGMPDVRNERIAAGTIGGEHLVQRGVGGKKVNAIIDDSDSRIIYGYVTGYGATSGTFTGYGSANYVYGGTQTVIGGGINPGSPGSAAQFSFTGTSIAVLGSVNPDSGNMRVYIDGVETKGRIPITTVPKLAVPLVTPWLTSTATSMSTLSQATSFSASGYAYINGEIIQYTSRDSNGFYGCTRGALGTQASSHNANETIYQWDSSIGLYSAAYGNRQVLYYNPMLSSGTHTITIIAETNSISNNAKIYFDGFVQAGSLLGSGNIAAQLYTFTFTSVATDANGHVDLGSPVSVNNDIAQLSVLGYTQSNCESSNTTAMGKLGIRYQVDGSPVYYLHNAAASSTFNVTITFVYLGETL